MIGDISGLGRRLEAKLGRPIPIRHHCLAHKLQLMLKKALGGFPVFETLKNHVQKILTFFRLSHKRTNALNDFLDDIGVAHFKLGQIFDVR